MDHFSAKEFRNEQGAGMGIMSVSGQWLPPARWLRHFNRCTHQDLT